jgi:murein DD-endopeptidase MepM/ murein hydrolase activator NlpD
MKTEIFKLTVSGASIFLLLAGCSSNANTELFLDVPGSQAAEENQIIEGEYLPRPAYDPGTLVEYIAQSGDTVSALAGRFNSNVEEIMDANPIIPQTVSTLPPGFPMNIPIYYRPFWGSQYLILPDGLYPNGPAQMNFNSQEFVDEQIGWFNGFEDSAAQDVLSAAEIVDLVSTNFSISPRFLIALMEYSTEAISNSELDSEMEIYPLGFRSQFHRGLYLQLVWAANTLNNGYYGWRSGNMIEFELLDGSLYRPDPWQSASSVALQYLFSKSLENDAFDEAIGPQGFAASYANLFGNPWDTENDHIPGSLQLPTLRLPFIPGDPWTLTGGPHTGWGEGQPWAALDLAPGVETSGCVKTEVWATAVADGLVVRTGLGTLVLDLDSDGDERTGWVIFYLHLEERGRAKVGSQLLAGEALGHPSCEGGSSTGTHIHIARKYNGEWIAAAGDVPFVMENWIPYDGETEYEGGLAKLGQNVSACRCSDANSSISSTAIQVDFPTPAAFDLVVPSQTP